MNTNRKPRNEQANLSVTTKGQENYGSASSGHHNNLGHSLNQESKDTSYSKSHECSGGICSTTWKPIHNCA